MDTPPEPPPRFVDNRGKKKAPAPAPELVVDPAVAEGMAAQAAAAEEEKAAEPALVVTTFAILTLGLDGGMQLMTDQASIQAAISGGISTQRQATPADIMNMSGQLATVCLANELSGRVMGVLQQQAMQQVMQRMKPDSGLATG